MRLLDIVIVFWAARARDTSMVGLIFGYVKSPVDPSRAPLSRAIPGRANRPADAVESPSAARRKPGGKTLAEVA